jgi:hypothetical protein
MSITPETAPAALQHVERPADADHIGHLTAPKTPIALG